MKRTLTLIALLATLLIIAPGTATAKKLPMAEAALQTRITVGDWGDNRGYSYPDWAKCIRKSAKRVICRATITKDTESHRARCNAKVSVRNRYVRLQYWGYWEAKPRMMGKPKCRSVAKPKLTRQAAEAAAQAEANRISEADAVLTNFFRYSRTSAAVDAQWYQPGPYGLETCELYLTVKLVARKPMVAVIGPSCY